MGSWGRWQEALRFADPEGLGHLPEGETSHSGTMSPRGCANALASLPPGRHLSGTLGRCCDTNSAETPPLRTAQGGQATTTPRVSQHFDDVLFGTWVLLSPWGCTRPLGTSPMGTSSPEVLGHSGEMQQHWAWPPKGATRPEEPSGRWSLCQQQPRGACSAAAATSCWPRGRLHANTPHLAQSPLVFQLFGPLRGPISHIPLWVLVRGPLRGPCWISVLETFGLRRKGSCSKNTKGCPRI